MEDRKNHASDDEDLEALRLAALQTLNKNSIPHRDNKHHKTGFTNNKRNRYYNGQGFKNGYNSRIRVNNLIPITPIDKDEDKLPPHSNSNAKFTLPQDRYVSNKKSAKTKKPDGSDGASGGGSSKFDRYNDSSKSDDESEEEVSKNDSPDTTSPLKLERSDSLEALIRELDNEIQDGVEKEKKQSDIDIKDKNSTNDVAKTVKEEEVCENADDIAKTDLKPEEPVINDTPAAKDSPETNKTTAPLIRKRKYLSPIHDNYKTDSRQFSHQQHHGGGPVYREPPSQFPPFMPLYIQQSNVLPFTDRPLSPFLLEAESLQAQTMAPLSPRSAAFVLENRAIIERRKRSPRRSSYSRSPSPRLRSLSPKSSLKRRRSISPRSPRQRPRSPLSPLKSKRFSPKHRTFSPKQRRYNSPAMRRRSSVTPPPSTAAGAKSVPKCGSMSPKRRANKDSDASPVNKPNIRDRLGFKSSAKSADNKVNNQKESSPNNKDEKQPSILDPVLAARKRKFESKEIQIKEGVIRLKLKKEPEIEQTEEQEEKKISPLLNESVEDDALDLEAKDELALFSDDENSDEENEGRFKTKQGSVGDKPTVLPYTKLVNHTNKSPVKQPPLKSIKSKTVNKKNSEISKQSAVKHSTETKRNEENNKKNTSRNNVSTQQHGIERKLKVRKTNDNKIKEKKRIKSEDESRDRKIVYGITNEHGKRRIPEEYQTEIIIESGDEQEKLSSVDKEDLRTQLCKKRAEKRQKTSSSNKSSGGTSRLLQNALQSALPAKISKKRTSQETNDGKLPIHLRLGLSSGVEPTIKLNEQRENSVEAEDQV